MKLIIVTCLKDFQKDVEKIFVEANVQVFSMLDLVGSKTNLSSNMQEEWFAVGAGKFDSALLFSFTEEKTADQILHFVTEYNSRSESAFPLRAFVLPVEKMVGERGEK
jgi:hypothetical protein